MPKRMTRVPILAGLLALLAAVPGHAQTASLVADLAPTEDEAAGSDPDKLTAVRGGRIVFEANEDRFGSGRELWGSDGTPEGTVLLADSCPGPSCQSQVTVHGTLNGVALVSDVLGNMLVSDGTREGTFLLRDSSEGGVPLRGVSRSTAVFGGFFYFEACDRLWRCGLWRTDGTLEGTHRFASRTRLGGEVAALAVTDRALFFTIARPDFSALLWRTDGTAAGTVRLATFRHPSRPLPDPLTPAGSKLFFIGPGYAGLELWVSDGTRAGTRPVTHFGPPRPFGGRSPSGPPLLFAEEDRVDFAVNDGVHSWEIWQSDGTPEGTRRITDFPFFWYPFLGTSTLPLSAAGGRVLISAYSYDDARLDLWATDGRSMVRLHTCLGGCDFSELPRLVIHGDRVLFTAGAGSGQELWGTDGTPAGTRKLLNACTGACDAFINLTSASLGGLAVFEISAGGKKQLWATDGTAAGTRPLFHLPPGTATGALPVAAGEKVFFGAADEDGMELWVSEGGQERQAANLIAEAASSSPTSLVALGPRLVFQAGLPEPPFDTRGLWQSEGTEASTSRILDSFRQPTGCYFLYCFAPKAAADGWLALVNAPSDEVNELWRTDGTAAGTFRLLTVEAPDRIRRLAAFQDTVVFFVERPQHLEIWRSDGTTGGTYRIADQGDMEASGLGGTGTEVHFQLATSHSLELWRSDGTAEGTVRVAGLPRRPGDLLDVPPIRAGQRIMFGLYGPSLEELWSTDGTQEGTALVMATERLMSDRQVLGGQLYFTTLFNLWRSDGTAAGTVRLGSWNSVPTSLTVFAGRLFFAAGGSFESELWSTDGTPAGTRKVLEISPDIGSDPTNFAVFGDHLYFSAFDPEHGYELWQSDGTAGGTRLYQDIFPGILSSSPDQLTVVGDHLYFTADDGARGRELWSISLGIR